MHLSFPVQNRTESAVYRHRHHRHRSSEVTDIIDETASLAPGTPLGGLSSHRPRWVACHETVTRLTRDSVTSPRLGLMT